MSNLSRIGRIGRKRSGPTYIPFISAHVQGVQFLDPSAPNVGFVSVPQTDDIILAHVTVTNGSDGATITPPASQGWAVLESVEDTTSANSINAVYWKRWGVVGNTDSTAPAFTASSGLVAVICSTVTSANGTGTPWSATEHGTNHGSGTTLTAPDKTKDAGSRCVLRFFHGVASASKISATSETAMYLDTSAVLGMDGGALTAGTAANALGASSMAPGIPAGGSGTLLLLHIYMEVAASANGDPSGWTLLHTTTHAGGELHRLYGRIRDGSEGATVTVPLNSGGGGRQIGQVFNVPGQFRTTLANNFSSITSADFNSGADPGGPTVAAAPSVVLAFIGYDSGGTIAPISGGTGTWSEVAPEAVAGSAAGGIGIVTDITGANAGLSGGTAVLSNVANSNVITVVFNPTSQMAASQLVNQTSGATGTATATAAATSTWGAITVIVDPTFSAPAAVTPSWIASGTRDTTGTAGSTPAYGTNVAGDLFVMTVTGRITALTVPAGWTEVAGPNDIAGRQVHILVRDARSTGGESGTVAVTLTANSQISVIHTFRNVSTSFFLEALAAGGSASNGNSVAGPTVPAFSNNRLAVMVWGNGDDAITPAVVTGMSGGTWVMRDSATTGTGSNCAYAISTADLTSGGTISGGTAAITSVNEHSVIGFAIVGIGATSWATSNIANRVAQFQGDAGVTGGASVTAWADQTGNGHTLATAGSNPGWSATAWNGAKPALTFASSQFLINSDAALGNLVDGTNTAFTVFATLNFTNAVYATLMEWSDNSITNIFSIRTITGTGAAQVDKLFGEAHGANNIRGVGRRICIYNDGSGNVTYLVDGTTEINAVALSGTFAVDRVLVGNNWNVSNPLGTLAELIVCTGDQRASFPNYRANSKLHWGG